MKRSDNDDDQRSQCHCRAHARGQVASDLGVGLSTLNKWVKMVSDEAGPTAPDRNLLRENERLRRENRILKEERELLKKATQFFAAQKP